MKTFTKFFTFLFAFILLSSMNANAFDSPWSDPDGDPGQPQFEIFVYGITLPAVTPAVGDQIAVFSGGTLAGLLTLTVVPSINNWTSSHLVAYSYNMDGDQLYTPGTAFMLKYWDASTDAVYNAWTWGDGNHIDFHNSWYAPTSDLEASATTYGAYFPGDGAYSYAYTNLTFTADAAPLEAVVTITIWEDNIITPAIGATVTSGGYTAADNLDGTYTLDLFAGQDGDDQDFYYTVLVQLVGFDDETFDITVNEDPGTFAKTVYLNAVADLSGTITGFVSAAPLSGVLVTTTIDGTVYSDNTDAAGDYLIADIPDGTWEFTYSLSGYTSKTISSVMEHDNTTNTVTDATLDLLRGYITGEIFDATTIGLITQPVTISVYDANDVLLEDETTSTGSYTIGYYGGTYKIVVSSPNPGGGTQYDNFTIDEHTFYPEFTEEMNFNLLPNGTAAHYAAVTGDPNTLWSIHIEMAKFGANLLLPFDEIAVYDLGAIPGISPEVLVGTLQLDDIADWQHSGTNVLKAFGTLTATAGFVEGHRMQFRAWDISHQDEYEVPLEFSFNAGVGTWSDTLFPNPLDNEVSYLNVYWETVPGELTGTVSDNLAAGIDGVLVEVLNRYTNELIDSETTAGGGLYSFWPMDAGTYNVKFTKIGYATYLAQDVVVNANEIKTLDVTLGARTAVTMAYVYDDAPGYYFIGRAVQQDGVATPDMRTLLDDEGTSFTDLRVLSWVKSEDETDDLHFTAGAPGSWGVDFVWDLKTGYQLYLDADHSFDMDAFPAGSGDYYLVEPENNPITLAGAGFYYVPYFPYTYQADPLDYDDAMTAFAGIFAELDWVMDSDGNRLHHDGGAWVDNIGTLSPTQGYKVKMLDAATLTYPAVATKSAANRSVRMDPEHFVYTGGNAAGWTYTIYIETDDFEIGDEIAAFSNGTLVGSMVIDSDDSWQNGLVTFNEGVEGGYVVGSPIELRAWDVSENIDYSVGFAMVNVNEACYTGVNYPGGLLQFSYAHVTRGIVRVDENQINNSVKVYPNPAKGILNIESVNTINQIHMYNVYGALISNITVNTQHQQMDVSNLIPGTYLIQLTTSNGIITKRVIIQ